MLTMVDLGNRLQELRSKLNMRQEDVAKKIGVGRTTYAMYEQGKENLTMKRFSSLLIYLRFQQIIC
ncbi:hypothetical protein DI43_13205 [Geobacillus sp. CAMR12739]|nr:hypothetical protein DI43_13205 [Geobacillus sp. CAMR12739]